MSQAAQSEAVELPRDLPTLTSLRAFAALGVFGYHAGQVLPGAISVLGFTGVGFFFVLSGFVLAWGGGAGSNTGRFYTRRFARIWPAHATIWLLLIIFPLEAARPDLLEAVTNLFLLQSWGGDLQFAYSMNGVSWSLSCEVFFYLILPAATAVLSRLSHASAWAACSFLFIASSTFAITATELHFPDPWLTFASVNPLVRLPEFLLGVVGARWLRDGGRAPVGAFAGAVAIAAAGVALVHQTPAITACVVPLFLAIIVFVTQRQVDGRTPLLGARPLVYAGKVSFAFYLVHQLVLVNVYRSLGQGVAPALLSLVIAAMSAIALHHCIELPAHRLLTAATRSRKQVTSSDSVTE